MRFLENMKSLNPLWPAAKRFYHLWFYNTLVWTKTSWMGVNTYKSPMDMWNYQEILVSLQPSVIIEFGTCNGGSALFFAGIMRLLGQPFVVLSVDVAADRVSEKAKSDPDIRLLTMSSDREEVRAVIENLRRDYPGPAFAILDSDHSKDHVLGELMNLRSVLVSGDYLIVEDSNVNGHPVHRSFGPGPYEAIEEYFRRFPDDYAHDWERERKFGFSFAPHGFLRRR